DAGPAARAAGAEVRGLQEVFKPGRAEVRIQRIEADQGALGRPPLQRGGDAEPFLVMLENTVARQAGREAVDGAWSGPDVATLPAHRAVPLLQSLAARIGDR